MTTAADELIEGASVHSLNHENLQLKKDLDFATSEIERLRAKLVFDKDELPALSDEFFATTISG